MPIPEAPSCGADLDALHDHALLRWLLYIPPRPLVLHSGAESVWIPGEGGLVLLPANATARPTVPKCHSRAYHASTQVDASSHVGAATVLQHLRRELAVGGDGACTWVAGSADASTVLGALPIHQLLQRQRLDNLQAARRGLHALQDVVQVRMCDT